MEITTKQTIGTSSAIIVAIISLIIGMGGSPDAGNWHYGLDNQSNIICGPIQCDKLNLQNDDGISSRCYFFSEEKNRTTYKICKSGWIKFENIKTPEINLSDNNFIYLYCDKKENSLVSNCKIVNSDETIIKLENK